MNCIRIKRVWSDDCMIELEFDAKSTNIQSKINFYVTKEYLLDLREILLNFPMNRDDIIEWDDGIDETNSYVYFKLKIFLYDRQGHVGVEIIMDNKQEKPHTLKSHFYILTEVGSINDFGKKMSYLLTEDGASIEGIVSAN